MSKFLKSAVAVIVIMATWPAYADNTLGGFGGNDYPVMPGPTIIQPDGRGGYQGIDSFGNPIIIEGPSGGGALIYNEHPGARRRPSPPKDDRCFAAKIIPLFEPMCL